VVIESELAVWPSSKMPIDVAHYSGTDGGGTRYWPALFKLFKIAGINRAHRCFEWCAGPGFLGFAAVAAGFCETLVLADVNEASLAAARETIARNGLEGIVFLYHSGKIGNIPASEHGRFDVVFGNPPHFAVTDGKVAHGWTTFGKKVNWTLDDADMYSAPNPHPRVHS
jgi:16S rRNA G966 N2-methylase RsmD